MKSSIILVILVLSGCGHGPDEGAGCAAAQAKVQASWKSPPDKVSGNTWTYIEDGVGTFNYKFDVEADGSCKTTESGSFGS